eukprot:COSAG05_NODE_11682_length_502_cov_0.913151_1_plen_113_part_10
MLVTELRGAARYVGDEEREAEDVYTTPPGEQITPSSVDQRKQGRESSKAPRGAPVAPSGAPVAPSRDHHENTFSVSINGSSGQASTNMRALLAQQTSTSEDEDQDEEVEIYGC